MRHTTFRKAIAVCLVFAVLIAVPLPVHAQNHLVVEILVKDEGWHSLNLLKSGNTWYAKAGDLAQIAKVEIEHKKNTLTFFKSDPVCTLHAVKSDTYTVFGGSYYVPLQESSAKIGIRFHVGDNITAEVLRTPAQLKAEVCAVFTDERFQLSSITNTGVFGVMESLGRLYAALPFVGSGTLIGAITGKDEADRYRTMMIAIMGNSGSLSDFMSDCADIDGNAKKYAKIIKNAKDISKKGGKVYNFLQSKGIDEKTLDLLAYEYNPYEHDLGDWLDDYTTVANVVDIEYFLDVMAFYAAIEDMDESTLLAMKRVFENSENTYIQNAMKLAVNKRFGDEYLAIADIYAGTAGNIVINLLNESLENSLSGGYDQMIGIGTTAFEVFVHPSDISEALIYLSIGTSIQKEIQNY